MKRRLFSFNIYFLLGCLILAGAGCALVGAGSGSKKELTTIRLYLEGQRADSNTSGTVLVTSNKFPYTVEREAFLDEGDLAKAAVVDNADGTFYLQLGFNNHGALLLDMYTSSNKGKHVIVFSQFPTPGQKAKKQKKKDEKSDGTDASEPGAELPKGEARQSGWLAAVLIRDRLSNGVFRFTPDTSRDEAARIVRGLRNVISKNGGGKD